MSQQELQRIKGELDQLKAQLGAAQIRKNEVMGALKNTYGVATAKEAQTEHTKLTGKTIPTMERKRDGLVSKAQEVLSGINTQAGAGGHTGAQGGPAGPANTTGPAEGRTLVGKKR